MGWLGTALKPAHEPIVLARKPLVGPVAANVMTHRVGALNIDASRLAGEPRTRAVERPKGPTGGATSFGKSATKREPVGLGRWPANLVLSHLPDCEGSGPKHTEVLCAPGCPVAELDAMSVGAARFFYVVKPKTRERIGGTIRNLHPTVKAVDLMRYLVRLVTPPGGVVLDPFLGSGCAAMAEGFRFVGIEREQESFDTSLARIADYAFAHGRLRPSVS